MRRIAIALLAVAAATGCEHVVVRPLRAVSAAGDAPGYRLWWVEDLLFEAPDGWDSKRTGRTFATWNAHEPECESRRFHEEYRYSFEGPSAIGRCSTVALTILDHEMRDEEACWEKVVIVRASGYLGPKVDLNASEDTFAGMRALRDGFAEGFGPDRYRCDRFFFCKGPKLYVIGFYRPDDRAEQLAPAWAHLLETARLAPSGAVPHVSGASAE